MRYLALGADYDATLARNGRVALAMVEALERVRASGRRLILVTGRQLEDILAIFPQIHLFDRLVAENGALLYQPATREMRVLAEAPPDQFQAALRARGVQPLSTGHVILATVKPQEGTVLEVIRELGLELQVIFNRSSVMVLPSGINKATGLAAALGELGLSPHNTVAIGDAENDHAFLSLCECAVAVSDAVPTLKERSDYVTRSDGSAGVVEIIEGLIADDLRELEPCVARHQILLGTRDGDREVRVNPYGVNLLLAGPSGAGKSTVANAFLERLAEAGYQFCVVDPEGDYETFEKAAMLGNSGRAPSTTEIMHLLERPAANAVINLLGLPIEDRPRFFAQLFPHLQELRTRSGRPHWIVVDEAHHLLPPSWHPAELALPQQLGGGLALITVHPDRVAASVLSTVDIAIAVGESAADTLRSLSRVLEQAVPAAPGAPEPGEALAWMRHPPQEVFRFKVARSSGDRRRHVRKYAEGDLGPHSFHFRGPDGRLNLRAQNLMLFMQIAEGIDDATWLHHLRRGDYSRWFREAIKDDGLAAEAADVEAMVDQPAGASRARIRAAIEKRYAV